MNKNSKERRIPQLADRDSGTVISSLTVGKQIEHHFDARQLLAHRYIPERVAIKGVEGDHIQAFVVGYKNGALVVKLLRDDRKGTLPEDIAATQNAVECAVACIINNYVFGGHPTGDEVLHHHGRLVIVLRVVSAYYNVIDLARHVQCYSGLYAVLVVSIDDVLAAVLIFCRTQQQAHPILWNGIDVGIYLRSGIVYDLSVHHDHRRCRDQQEKNDSISQKPVQHTNK